MADSTTINFTSKNSLASAGVAHRGTPELFEARIDCRAATGQELAAASYALFDIPAGYMHLSTVLDVEVAEGGASTIDIGVTGGTVDTMLDGGDVNAVAISSDLDADWCSTGTSAGYVTTADTTVSLLCNDALDAAVFNITSLWVNMNAVLDQPTPNSV